jgi:hypothetical protein
VPLGELAEPLLRIIAEVVFEILWKGAGYVIVKWGWYQGRRGPDPDGWVVILVGGAFWVALAFACYQWYHHAAIGKLSNAT